MPQFITIGYGEAKDYERTDADVRERAHAHDAKLVADGAQVGMAGAPVQVRNHEGSGVQTTEGPFLKSDMPIAGFALIEAEDLDEAVELVSQTPCAVAYGVVEVWPLITSP